MQLLINYRSYPYMPSCSFIFSVQMKDEWSRIARKVYVDKRNFVCMMYAKH